MMQALGTWRARPALPVLAGTAVMLIGRDLTPAVFASRARPRPQRRSARLEDGRARAADRADHHAHRPRAPGRGRWRGRRRGRRRRRRRGGRRGTGHLRRCARRSCRGRARGRARRRDHRRDRAALLITAPLVVWIGRREGVALLEPVTRPAGQEAPDPVHI
ncbi:hypothetical protein [Brachybacterium sp. GPGPB12]|uniref:hypothetical protein n=1 Tax=Brachybacterium sp. GPGPB12 TaxID=3023517 RepID=UPI003134448B